MLAIPRYGERRRKRSSHMILTLSTAFFILINLVVSPFYLLIVIAPRAVLTRRVLATLWPVALPALVHVAFILVIILVARPNVLQLWQSLYLEHGMFGSTTVTMLSQLYGQFPEYATLHGWVHVVVGDIFMARWAYLDALERGLPNWLIVLVAALIAFTGPVGVIVHLIFRPRYRRASPVTSPAA
jgi:hypothetical protein